MTDPTTTEAGDDSRLRDFAAALDFNAALTRITDEQVADLIAGITAMIEGKVAMKRDGDREMAEACTEDAGTHLLLLGNLGRQLAEAGA